MATIGQLLIVAIFLPACAAQPQPGNEAVVGTGTSPSASASTEPVDQRVTAARADAAKRSGLPPAQLQVVTAGPVTWSDGSLGCPRPGMLYTQALVPGYRVQLRVGSEIWNYHGSERVALALCPAGQAQEPVANSRN